jgi:hypothetical protein
MSPRLRKLTLFLHVVCAVGWIGSVAAYLALALTAQRSDDVQLVRAAYLSMSLIGWDVIVPLSFASLATGLIQSLGTEWGLFRHYWIAVKFFLTVFAVFVLWKHMGRVSRVAAWAADPSFSLASLGEDRFALVLHPALGLVVLLVNTVLSFWKPWGMTPHGRRVQEERRSSRASAAPEPVAAPTLAVASNGNAAWWAKAVGAHVAIVLVLAAVVAHLTGHVPQH